MSRKEKAKSELWGSTFVKRKKANIVLKQRQAPMHITPSMDFTLLLSLSYYLTCAFML
jgi:hypothetical protein